MHSHLGPDVAPLVNCSQNKGSCICIWPCVLMSRPQGHREAGRKSNMPAESAKGGPCQCAMMPGISDGYATYCTSQKVFTMLALSCHLSMAWPVTDTVR